MNYFNARLDLDLIISPRELKQIKNCTASKQLWNNMEIVYQNMGLVRKAALFKRLSLLKMQEMEMEEHVDI